MSFSLPNSGERAFPQTGWTRVLRLRPGQTDSEVKKTLEELCRIYWTPVFAFLCDLGCSREEAQDVTQDFFTNFLQNGGFEKADPEQGRMRSWIRQSVRYHLYNWRTRQSTQRRGGGQTGFSLDELAEGQLPSLPPTAVEAYDHRWAWTTLDEAMKSLRAAYAERGKESIFDQLKPYLLNTDEANSSVALANSLGITPGHASVELHRARRRFAGALRSTVAETVDDWSAVDDEVRYVLRSILSRNAHT